GAALRFEAVVGVDDEVGATGSVSFQLWVDGKIAVDTGVLKGGAPAQPISVNLDGAKYLALIVTDGGDGISCDHADWADAHFTLKPGASEAPGPLQFNDEPPPPIASGTPAEPQIHGPRVVGATPKRDFLFLIPATGEGPLRYAAKNLPAGLTIDAKSGMITGAIAQAGETDVEIEVTGAKGTGRRALKIVAGDHKLALTPPMGWNSWYIHYKNVTETDIRNAADALIRTGLAAHGYQYVCIDDGWADGRNADGSIRPNAAKFGDMKALADYIHSKGLKFGTYSSPGKKTCCELEGSYGHEAQDARTYAAWGVDLLKYDWCYYSEIEKGNTLEEMQHPYRVMREALDGVDRDIVYSLCQYGMGKVWEWGADVGGNMWRTMGDIGAEGDSSGVLRIGFAHGDLGKTIRPGHWNDPDMLMVGRVAVAAKLTRNEAITQVSLWAMMAAPLVLSCDFSQLDQFTLDILTNDEIIDVNQDPLGKAGGRVTRDLFTEVWSRPLYDGTVAVALFNRGPARAPVTAKWADVGLTGSQAVRDLWQKKDLGVVKDAYTAEIPARGCVVVKVGTPKGN
ncbi:MAG: NPCBM/NEW2 domain-containing protein, partial [Candidatus Hydrogenedentes bacterium]|nr:NPCBM/NEW2 domain-containing protein [Candidatus Hydrogenedentota bacterium]